MHIEPVNDDPIRHYTKDEESLLDEHLRRITEQVRKIDSRTKEYTVALVCEWHEDFFAGVRDHAGRHRGIDYGEERLSFGPNLSVLKADVPGELAKHELQARDLIGQLADYERKAEPEAFIQEVIKVGVYLHAELIRIHPFRDGNGRIGRLIITYLLCRFRLPPVIFEIPKQEYFDCLNHYYKTKDINPLVELVLRLYRNQLATD